LSTEQAPGPVAILCGGRGTRLQERTHAIPKALVEIGGRPILWHVMRIYAAQGLRRFVLLTGYLGEMIEEFVATAEWPEAVDVRCVDTGLDTPTGGRVALAAEHLDGGPFCLTYADGVADIDLDALIASHRRAGRIATMTVVRPYSQWGIAVIDDVDERITGFDEKPRLDYWINGGFMCLEPEFLERARAGAVAARGGRRAAQRLPPHRLLGLHGHLQGRRRAQRPLGAARRPVGRLGPGARGGPECLTSPS
jgi:glucose-1-phosphate cytidylyltransferase